MKSFAASVSLAIAGLLAGSAAMAADAPAAPAGDEALAACKPDIERLCPGVQPGEGRIKECMKQHRKDLSPDCKKEIMAARKARKG